MAGNVTEHMSELELEFGNSTPEATVGERVLLLRSISGMSQRELAKRAGLTNSLISTIEQDKVSPSISTLQKVLLGFGLSLPQFFSLSLTAGAVEVQPARSVSHRNLLVAAKTSTNLLVANDLGGAAIVCLKGRVILRDAAGERELLAGQSLSVAARGAYALINDASSDASLMLASFS